MALGSILLGLLDAVIVAIVLVLVGAILVWIADLFRFPIPWEIQRLYLLLVMVILVYLFAAVLFGMPAVHIFGRAHATIFYPHSMDASSVAMLAALTFTRRQPAVVGKHECSRG